MGANPEPDEMVFMFCADCTPPITYVHGVDRARCMHFLEVE